MARLVVLDALGLIYRAHYAFISRPLMNSKGENTSAIFGMANLIARFRRELAPDRWALAWDGPGPTFRHELYTEYKAHRPPMPDDLKAQLSPIEEMAQLLGLPVIEKQGMEADDVMATLAAMGAAAGDEVILITGDKDMLQVVGGTVTVLSPGGRGDEYTRMDPDAVLAKWGVGPEHIRDVLALMGDSSDNIPGVKGVGEKTATELLRTFGSLEAIYDRIDEVTKPALKKKLVESKAMAYLSRELATLKHDLDLGLTLEDLPCAPIRRDALLVFAKRWEIRRLEAIASQDGVTEAAAGTPVAARERSRRGSAAEQREASTADDLFQTGTLTPSPAAVPASLAAAPQGDLFAAAATGDAGAPPLDPFIESLHAVRARSTHGLAIEPVWEGSAPRHGRLIGLALASRDGTTAYLPFAHSAGPNATLDQARDWLKAAFADAKCPKVAHDLKALGHLFSAHGLGFAGATHDLHMMSFLCDPERSHGLETLARDALAVELEPMTPLAARGRARLSVADQPVLEAARLAERRAAALWPLVETLTAQLEARELSSLYRDLEHPLIAVLAAMERAGITLDVDVLSRMSTQLGRDADALETRLQAIAGDPINLNSGQQLGQVLFDRLKLPPSKKTKTGYSTDAEVLEGLSGQHEFPRLLLEWRSLTKLRSTYVEALPTTVDPADGRVHTTFEQTGAATGRLASYDPNLQNIPIRTPQGRTIRRAFRAAAGCTLVGADYSQIELRVMAHLSGDPQLTEAFTAGEDVHASTARRIFKVEGDVPSELRARAKVVNFGVMYGMGSRSLAQQMGIELAEAKAFIEGYFTVYAGVRSYLDRTLEEARERGFVQTLLGRRRYLPQLRGGGMERSLAERAAINTPIQGSAADLVKLAMLRVHAALERRGSGARMLLQVHDELLLECPLGESAAIQDLVRREMEGCYPLAVPLTVTVGQGETWFDVH